jgi:phosphatidate cytidylyltransferase
MTASSAHRLLSIHDALAHPFVRAAVAGLAVVLAAFPVVLAVVQRARPIDEKVRRELWDRYLSWLIFVPLMVGPVLLGAAATIGAVGMLGLACYREFARATGLFRWTLGSAVVAVGIIAITLSVADHWYSLFVALPTLWIGVIAAAALLVDRPSDYIQRVALATFAYLLFGVCFGHLGYLANDGRYRPILFWLVLCVEGNDILAYVAGKAVGRRHFAPNTSPNKTVGGAVGALVGTTVLAVLLGRPALAGLSVDTVPRLVLLGLILSVTAQVGDLTLSSVKRNLNIKDWAATFPGHGGLLDRFNSLLFSAPAAMLFIGYFDGIGLDQPSRIFTGGGW